MCVLDWDLTFDTKIKEHAQFQKKKLFVPKYMYYNIFSIVPGENTNFSNENLFKSKNQIEHILPSWQLPDIYNSIVLLISLVSSPNFMLIFCI